jgi:hypothetical protein|uniref:Uncharacterized protein n=2 Tax=Picea TaxID=3328 RepID=A0A124GMX0_PICGL|nr:hypothetical protein ABT39_MTgene5991 [Picea glauca]QHR91466.1 hypothetical protein Q903MT_gene5500 [Picea sitchensis]
MVLSLDLLPMELSMDRRTEEHYRLNNGKLGWIGNHREVDG